MKRRITLLAICIGIAFTAVLAVQYSTEAQRQAGGAAERAPRGQSMMMQFLPLEMSWAQVCFELGVTDEVLPNARKVYQEAWGERKKLLEKAAAAGGDRDVLRALRTDAEKLKSDLEKKLKDILTAGQLEKLAKWEEETRSRARSRRPPQAPGQQR